MGYAIPPDGPQVAFRPGVKETCIERIPFVRTPLRPATPHRLLATDRPDCAGRRHYLYRRYSGRSGGGRTGPGEAVEARQAPAGREAESRRPGASHRSNGPRQEGRRRRAFEETWQIEKGGPAVAQRVRRRRRGSGPRSARGRPRRPPRLYRRRRPINRALDRGRERPRHARGGARHRHVRADRRQRRHRHHRLRPRPRRRSRRRPHRQILQLHGHARGQGVRRLWARHARCRAGRRHRQTVEDQGSRSRRQGQPEEEGPSLLPRHRAESEAGQLQGAKRARRRLYEPGHPGDSITSSSTRTSLKIDIVNLSLGHPVLEPAATDPLVLAVERAVTRRPDRGSRLRQLRAQSRDRRRRLRRHHVAGQCAVGDYRRRLRYEEHGVARSTIRSRIIRRAVRVGTTATRSPTSSRREAGW